MGSITRSHSFVSGEKPTESEWNVDIDQLFTLVNGQLDTNNVDTSSSDGISVLNANQTITGTRTHSGTLTMADDIDLIFGTNSDIKIQYDEGTDDALLIDTGVEGAALAVVLKADQGDDAGDAWKLNVADGGVITLGNDIASKGTYVTQLTLTPNSTAASSTTAIVGHATVGGNLTVTGGVTVAGASAFDIGDSDKLLLGDSDDLQVYHDGSNSYIANATGALKLATETSGIAITIGHSTSETTVADNLTVTGTLGAGASTLASLVCTAAATFGGGTGSSGATITTGGAGTFDGILKTEDTTNATSTTDGSLQTDGGLSVALDVIVGDDLKLLTDSSVLSLGVDSDATLTHDGTTGVTIAANPIIVDSGDALTLDAHTGIFIFKDAGSEVLRFTEGNSGDVTVKLATNGKDLVFTDNGDATNMKILDAAAGINVPGEVQTTKIAYTDGDDAITIADGGGVTTSGTLTIGTVAAAGSDTDKFLVLDSSGNVDYRTGSQVLSDIGAAGSGSSTAADDISAGDGAVSIETTSGNITIDAQANDADVIIKVDDNGSAVTALTLDGSDEGNAIFVNDVQLKSDGALLEFGADLDTTLTHTDGTGLTLNSTNKLTFGDAASFIQQSADGTLRIDGEAIIDLNASTRVDVSGDLKVGGEVQTASIGYTDGDNAITIADGGGCTFAQDATFGDNTKVPLGDGGDADLYYDGTNVILLPGVVGNGSVGIGSTNFGPSDGSTVTTLRVANFGAQGDAGSLELVGQQASGSSSQTVGNIDFLGYATDGGTLTSRAAIRSVTESEYRNSTLEFWTNRADEAYTKRMVINSNGKVGIGQTDVDAMLHIKGAQNANHGTIKLESTDSDASYVGLFNRASGYHADSRRWIIGCNIDASGDLNFRRSTSSTGDPTTVAFTINKDGNATFAGAVGKASGSFRIDNPLESKKDTHHLVHSFVEGPQADLIYRGTATLSSGTATVNLDTAARMTDGTFVALNGNVQVFTSNESGWEAVRGSVSGNVLTIGSNDDTSTASVSWLVIGERKDQHMIDTDWTDSDGRVITEPQKPVEEEAEEEVEEEDKGEE